MEPLLEPLLKLNEKLKPTIQDLGPQIRLDYGKFVIYAIKDIGLYQLVSISKNHGMFISGEIIDVNIGEKDVFIQILRGGYISGVFTFNQSEN